MARKGETDQRSATERMEAARSVKHDAVMRELCWASIGTRLWPSFLMPNARPQPNYDWLLAIESPAGRLVYRVANDELAAFDHLERRDTNDGVPSVDKFAALLTLATMGW